MSFLSPRFFRTMLSGHSTLGLAVALLMYIICYSGTLAVFYKEFWRWELPTATTETLEIDGERLDRAVSNILEESDAYPAFIGLELPFGDWPRMSAAWNGQARFVDPEGRLQGPVDRPWSRFLARLHFALNLPLETGIVIVGLSGVLLTALVVSGFLAHPGIVRNAFSLRLDKSRQLQQTDLHNRLSVWAAPFHLVIAVTGALLGLAGLMGLLAALLLGKADEPGAAAGTTPGQTGERLAAAHLAPAWHAFRSRYPAQWPYYIGLSKPGTAAQMAAIHAVRPDRLYWSLQAHYDAAGTLIKETGGDGADPGARVMNSVFRLHFGNFAGMPSKIAYLVLGLGLCVIAVTGVNIWLARRQQRGLPTERLERCWLVAVWGTPLLIPLSAVTWLAAAVPPIPVFWGGLAGLLVMAWYGGRAQTWSVALRMAAVTACLAVVMAHGFRFGAASWSDAGRTINVLWLLIAVMLCLSLMLRRRAPVARNCK